MKSLWFGLTLGFFAGFGACLGRNLRSEPDQTRAAVIAVLTEQQAAWKSRRRGRLAPRSVIQLPDCP
jgi:hypothetical protein